MNKKSIVSLPSFTNCTCIINYYIKNKHFNNFQFIKNLSSWKKKRYMYVMHIEFHLFKDKPRPVVI